MTSQYSKGNLENTLCHDTQMKYLKRFVEDDRLGNSACYDRQTLSRSMIVMDRIGARWTQRTPSSEPSLWSALPGSSGQAVIVDYLDAELIRGLMLEFSLAPELFKTHLAGCEQHHTGEWAPSDLTTPPCLRSTQKVASFFSIDYRRPYEAPEGLNKATFDHARKQRCSLLRSFHLTDGSTVLFQHERYSVAWSAGKSSRPGAVICICDPTVDETAGASLFDVSIAAIQALPAGQPFDRSLIDCFESPLSSIVGLWNTVIFHMDLQISALEDQLEHDYWDKPQNPVSILHRAQRLSRRITTYMSHINSLGSDIGRKTTANALEGVDIDTKDVKDRLSVLSTRTDKAIPALLTSIAITEGAKASSLTAIAVWFAPLSLAVSIVSIDGHAPFGGRKYWIMACIAIPLLLLVIAVANTSDSFIASLGRRRGGRALLAMFKAKTHLSIRP